MFLKRLLIGLSIMMLFLQGCSVGQSKVLRFDDRHTFILKCYSASDMRFSYGGLNTLCLYCQPKYISKKRIIAPAKTSRNFKRRSTVGLFHVFEGPLRVQWRSLDNTLLDYTIDLNNVFPDKRILHKENPNQIYWRSPFSSTPAIVIEVNDRTLNLYTDVRIRLHIKDGDKVIKTGKNDRKLVFSKTFKQGGDK